MQVISATPTSPLITPALSDRRNLISCTNGFLIPSTQRSEKLRRVPVRLQRGRSGAKGEKEHATEEIAMEDVGELVI